MVSCSLLLGLVLVTISRPSRSNSRSISAGRESAITDRFGLSADILSFRCESIIRSLPETEPVTLFASAFCVYITNVMWRDCKRYHSCKKPQRLNRAADRPFRIDSKASWLIASCNHDPPQAFHSGNSNRHGCHGAVAFRIFWLALVRRHMHPPTVLGIAYIVHDYLAICLIGMSSDALSREPAPTLPRLIAPIRSLMGHAPQLTGTCALRRISKDRYRPVLTAPVAE